MAKSRIHRLWEWRKANRARVLAYQKEWRKKNKEKIKAQLAKWHEENKEHANAVIRQHYRQNPGPYKLRAKLRQKYLRKATPGWANKKKIEEFYKGCPPGYHVDHIIPLNGRNVCGLHVESNLQYLPAADNIRKSNTHG